MLSAFTSLPNIRLLTYSIRLVEQTEAHVLVRFLLLFLFFSLFGSLSGRSTTTSRGTRTRSCGSTTGRDGSEFCGARGDQLSSIHVSDHCNSQPQKPSLSR